MKKIININTLKKLDVDDISLITNDLILEVVDELSNELLPANELGLDEIALKSTLEFLLLTYLSVEGRKVKELQYYDKTLKLSANEIHALLDVATSGRIQANLYEDVVKTTGKSYSSYLEMLVDMMLQISAKDFVNEYHSRTILSAKSIDSILKESYPVRVLFDIYRSKIFIDNEIDSRSISKIKRFYLETIKSLLYFKNERLK